MDALVAQRVTRIVWFLGWLLTEMQTSVLFLHYEPFWGFQKDEVKELLLYGFLLRYVVIPIKYEFPCTDASGLEIEGWGWSPAIMLFCSQTLVKLLIYVSAATVCFNAQLGRLNMKTDSLSVLLHFTVHPPVPLIWDEQDDDISLIEAKQCVVVASRVGEDGTNAWLLHHVVEACGDGHGPGKATLVTVTVNWRNKDEWGDINP